MLSYAREERNLDRLQDKMQENSSSYIFIIVPILYFYVYTTASDGVIRTRKKIIRLHTCMHTYMRVHTYMYANACETIEKRSWKNFLWIVSLLYFYVCFFMHRKTTKILLILQKREGLLICMCQRKKDFFYMNSL